LKTDDLKRFMEKHPQWIVYPWHPLNSVLKKPGPEKTLREQQDKQSSRPD